MTITEHIEKDDHAKGKYLVAFRHPSGELLGIPLRGVTKDEAECMVGPLRWAFEFGCAAYRIAVRSTEVDVKDES